MTEDRGRNGSHHAVAGHCGRGPVFAESSSKLVELSERELGRSPPNRHCQIRRAGMVQLPDDAQATSERGRRRHAWSVAPNVVHMSLEQFERGFVGALTSDDVSVTADGRRLDTREAVVAWWADVGTEIEDEEAAQPSQGVELDS